jgi:benzaldehyde dehydrogenase (NAD)
MSLTHTVLFGAFLHGGQICMSTERILVPDSQYEPLVAALRAAWDTVEAKEARALFQPGSGERVRVLLAESVERGAANIFASSDTDTNIDTGAFVTPSIIGEVTTSMRLYTEESFGPTAAIIRVPDADETVLIDEMVRIANDTEYGLAAAVWGRDTARAEAVARRIEAGAVHVNAPTPADPPYVPHGGWKHSGWGRFNGAEGIRSFTQVGLRFVLRLGWLLTIPDALYRGLRLAATHAA